MEKTNKAKEKNGGNGEKDENNEKEITNDDDFVMIERNGEIISGGFNINSLLLKYKQSPMYTLNQKMTGGGPGNNVSDIFKDLAIPAGIFYNPIKTGGSSENKNNVIQEDEVDDDLYEKLVKMASVENKKQSPEKKQRKTRKTDISTKHSSSKLTKKHKLRLTQ